MGMTVDDIAGHPALHGFIQRQSRAFFAVYEADPHLASVFASQQRWLMSHAALALHFRRDPADPRTGLTAARFVDFIDEHGVASRNTGHAFINEMLQYDYALRLPDAGDGRTRPLEPAQITLAAADIWVTAHLSTLDDLDGGRRLETFTAAGSGALAAIHPLISDGLLSSSVVRKPEGTFSLFIWLNNGGIVMDWLVAAIEDIETDAERIPTAVVSVTDMARWLKLSRTHLSRKLVEVEKSGGIGWQGKRGRSAMWVSRGFLNEYRMMQAIKLAVIDAAFDTCFRQQRPAS